MSNHIILRSPTVGNRKQPLLQSQSTSNSSRFAEVAGGTTAECAAVCCCCPCGLVNLLVLAIYKLPAGLCRRAMKEKRRQQLIKKGLLPRRRSKCKCGCDDMELQIHPVVSVENSLIDVKPDESEKKVMELEKEMWERFYSTGFWRSSSQREAIKRESLK
ncbi:Pollen preferential protein [Melia azedarach]|nr:Pollen preferential protein [Melia azedarach]